MSEPRLTQAEIELTALIANRYWSSRACFACGHLGYCAHREIEIAAAEAVRLRLYGVERGSTA